MNNLKRVLKLWCYGWSDFYTAVLLLNSDHQMFWEVLNNGWYQMYIFPWDDWHTNHISDQRVLRLAEKRKY